MEAAMKSIRRSILLSFGIILTACLVIAAAAGAQPAKKCYNDAGEEIPCDSNYLQTREAERAAARDSGPAATAVVASATASPTSTPTSTATPSQTPMPTVIQAQAAAPPAATALPTPTPRPSATMVLIPVALLGCAGVLAVILVFLVFRRLPGRRNNPPGGSD
jgi:hypothetical protein